MLPPVETDEQWDAVVPDETVMRPGVEALCARVGLADAPLTRFPDGSQPVYAVGDEHVLKLFPGAAAQDGVAEGRVLSYLQGRLPITTPQVREFGPYENGWQFVLMSRLRGENLAHAWDRIPQAHRERLVAEIGEALAVLHSLDPGPLEDVLGPGDWGAFLDRRREGTVEQQRAHGLPAGWLEQIPEFLASVPLSRAPHRSLLHTEVMQQHFLVDPDGWRLTGLFDFEPAMIGDRAYDFVGVGLFVTRGDPELLARLAKSYGHIFEPTELLAYTLLHVYSNLPWYMRELHVPAEGTLPSLAEAWFTAA
ncbi:aminoglycoside 3'-phosphotransferase/choline kinase family protein [Streptomyces sp. NBC_00873]|uniref:phosphotransferase n=1 Tax=unclassified Streptomyces TaxID=2593676 RepID=UPI003869DF61|nr:aminoglycoside 3'-phosphotransferase/choline kinase family protein [Streptomyces sp. NBC_00873]WSY96718.1 aminoglycoside 3'-phosphotransferase/choline kinase family protein [Streptomyces sp. NBC_00873]WTA41508.1 aminoglycoside 3'-phosphotransferase/choline kinase family protein [Streptomyces sp. NBC_00842]WTA48388.1 aminoglycoside 3'-phosphotransferase/choline kinase family protein [Streptomyces sp. NBC_00842]